MGSKKRAETTKHRPGEVKSKRLKVVCGACNNGWMGRIEEQTKHILEPMIKGEFIILDHSNQLQLATWLTLKIVVAEHNLNKHVSNIETRKAFKQTPAPLHGMRIWIAQCGEDGWQSAYWRHSACLRLSEPPRDSAKLDRSDNSQSITFGIGDLFIHAHHTTVSGLDLDCQFPDRLAILPLWPIINQRIVWPPLRKISALEANSISNTLDRLFDSPDVKWVD
jgi:hypothetical protein